MLSLQRKQTYLKNNIFVSDSHKHKTLFKLSVVITITLCTTTVDRILPIIQANRCHEISGISPSFST